MLKIKGMALTIWGALSLRGGNGGRGGDDNWCGPGANGADAGKGGIFQLETDSLAFSYDFQSNPVAINVNGGTGGDGGEGRESDSHGTPGGHGGNGANGGDAGSVYMHVYHTVNFGTGPQHVINSWAGDGGNGGSGNIGSPGGLGGNGGDGGKAVRNSTFKNILIRTGCSSNDDHVTMTIQTGNGGDGGNGGPDTDWNTLSDGGDGGDAYAETPTGIEGGGCIQAGTPGLGGLPNGEDGMLVLANGDCPEISRTNICSGPGGTYGAPYDTGWITIPPFTSGYELPEVSTPVGPGDPPPSPQIPCPTIPAQVAAKLRRRLRVIYHAGPASRPTHLHPREHLG